MKYLFRLAPLLVFPMLIALASGCDKASGEHSTRDESPLFEDEIGPGTSSLDHRPVVNFGFLRPIGSMVTTNAHQPLLDKLTALTPYRFRVLFSTDSERQVGVLEERLVEIAHLGIVSYLEAHQQFGAVPLVKALNRDGEPIARSVFVVREGSPLNDLTDLRGHSLALGAFHSTLSNLIPRNELLRAGVSVEDLEGLEHFDTDEAVAEAVLEGRFAAGAVKEVVAYRYREKGLGVLHVSSPIPTAPLVIRDDLPQRVSQAIREALLKLDFHETKDRQHWDEEIRYGFAPATDSDYDPIREIASSPSGSCAKGCHSSIEF